jgi:two-component system sensor histidine kinase KdpD
MALGIVVASTGVAEMFYRLLGTTRLSMIFLAGVLIVAVRLGSGPAYFASIAAFFVYNFYLVEPRFTVTIEAEDVLLLTVFLSVAMLTGGLAGRVRDEARRAQVRARTTAALFEASREFSSSGAEDAIRERLAHHIGEAAKSPAIVWSDGRLWRAPASVPVPAGFEAAARALDAAGDAAGLDGWRLRALSADGRGLGVAAWRLDGAQPMGVEEEQLVAVLVDLGAAAIARARLAIAQAEVDAMARTEQLRNALLSSLSHDLRTPLSAILASASSLDAFGEQFEPSVRKDLILTIQEEAERLNAFVGALLNMTRLESGGLKIEIAPFNVAEVVDRVVARTRPRLGRRRLERKTGRGDLMALGDPILFEQALVNVVENALRFSPEASRITVVAGRLGGTATIEVWDEGPGVACDELERIFDKFYRSPASSTKLQGTGLGLSITRGLVEAMNGAVTARRRGDGRSGLVISIVMPGETQ